jgi:PAS domain S-box-containing protein
MVVLMGGLLAAAAAGVGAIWREERVRDLRERYEAERERAWLHDVVARSLNEIYVFDPETLRFLFANRGACHNMGYTQQELAGLTIPDIKPEFTAATFRAMLEPLRSSERPALVYETLHRRKDGSEYPVEVHLQLVDSGAGSVFLSVINDITERKRAEQVLRQSEERFRATFEQAAVGIAHVALDGRFMRVNRKFADIVGYTRDEVQALSFQVITHPDDLDSDLALVRQLLDGAIATYSMEKRYVRKDGAPVWINLTKSLVRGPSGEPDYLIAVLEEIEARKHGEAALRESEERHRLASEAAQVGMWFWQVPTDSLVWTPICKKLFGLDPDQEVSYGVFENALHPDDRERTRLVIQRSWDERCDYRIEYRALWRDGTVHWLAALGRSYYDAKGQVERMMGVVIDIDDRKQAEESLRLQGAALAAAANAVMITDREGRIVWANDAFSQLTGWSLEECRGQTQRILKSGRYDPLFYEDIWQTILGGGVWRQEMVNRRKDGELYVEEQTITPVRDERGEITHFVAIKIDLAARKRAEAALSRSELRYRTLFDRNLAGVYRSTVDGGVLECNEAFAHICGYASRAEALAGGAKGLYPTPAAREAFVERLEAEGVVVNHEFEGRRVDGGAVWLLENAHLVAGDEPAAPRIIEGTLIDITERRRLAAQLLQSQKLEAIGRLAGGVAHDFNNILGVIIGYGELAQRQLGLEHPVRARVDQMVKAAERAAGLTRQLLAFSRQQVMQPSLLDLNAIVADTQRMLGRLIGEDVELVIHAAPDLGTVKADPGQIEQLILNLAVNARDAMLKGGSLTLETANVDVDEDYAAAHPPVTPGRCVMLAVSDTGSGMDQTTQQRIFEPFFTTKPEGQGTGLGLATVYGIVKQSGGYIWVYSEPGRGTTFKVYLPRVDEPAETAPRAGLTAETPRGDETILLVEDTETLQEVIRETLEERGYTVLLASNGEEALALALARAGPIDLLLTDVVMPKLGGGDLAKLIAARRPEIRVLYMSGYTDGAILQHGVLREGVMLLEKPFTGDKLARAVREALDRPTAT